MDTTIHFRNFLGPHQSSLCGIANVRDELLTLNPNTVTCNLCLTSLGRLRSGGFGVPPDKEPQGDS